MRRVLLTLLLAVLIMPVTGCLGQQEPRGGQINGEVVTTISEDYPVVDDSSGLRARFDKFDRVFAEIENGQEEVSVGLGPSELNNIEQMIESNYGIVGDRFYVRVNDSTVQITLLHHG